jgi:hypothetical protein
VVEKRVGVRIVAEGGRAVRAELQGVGAAGEAAFEEMNRAQNAAAQGAGRFRGQVQNVAFQVQDFAVQVGAGTSATQALAQQLPQLLGGFGLLGAAIGAVVAIGLPLGRALLSSGEAALTASESVAALEESLRRLQEVNEVYSTEGLQAVLDKYGELNAEILLLIERQRQFALESTLLAAKDAAGSLRGELSGVLSQLEAYQAYVSADQSDPANLVQAQDYADAIQEEFGLTILEAQALELALNAAMRTDDVEIMARAIASISTVLEGSTLAGSEFAGALLDAESALRAVNAEAGGIGGWLGAAISGTATWASALWDAANAARAAALASGPVAPTVTPGTGGPGTFPASGMPAPEFNGPRPPARPAEIDFGYSPPATTGGGRGGGGGTPSPAEPAYWDELIQNVKEGEKAFADYNKTVENGASAAADFFTSIVDGSKSAKEALSELLAQIGKVAMQQGLSQLGQSSGLIGTIFGALGGATSFDGGGYTGNGARAGGLDGKGGFLAMMHPRETVLDHTRGGGGGVVYNIDARGAGPDVDAKITSALRAYDREKFNNARMTSGDRRRVS